ncbi:hypothetical protein O9G_005960 [Rozella allomycis CSF55]|uniref:Decapping nuclease n=1 Tax=Rozella allomycis (strain CSF55) TaxID=988480 RepID=A0A075B1J1_ROZAC|nr:hypothetical protein O9G_005960 [Rozella allomycis CSF55]|eukprot:EPZ36223.1 hypothetical protein O9G_005960 [Rozella allomycis CSF55]
MDKFSYWGHHYEYICTHSVDNTDYDVDCNEEFGIVFKSSIGNIRLLLGAEVDCSQLVKDPVKILEEFIEIKTNKDIHNDKQEESFFRYKLPKVWLQSYLAGIPEIKFGYRNEKGLVVRQKSYLTKDLPKIADKKYNMSGNKIEIEKSGAQYEFVPLSIKTLVENNPEI